MTPLPLFQNSVNLRWSRVANFADIINNIAIILVKTFKNFLKNKRIRNYVLKCNLYLYFLI